MHAYWVRKGRFWNVIECMSLNAKVQRATQNGTQTMIISSFHGTGLDSKEVLKQKLNAEGYLLKSTQPNIDNHAFYQR